MLYTQGPLSPHAARKPWYLFLNMSYQQWLKPTKSNPTLLWKGVGGTGGGGRGSQTSLSKQTKHNWGSPNRRCFFLNRLDRVTLGNVAKSSQKKIVYYYFLSSSYTKFYSPSTDTIRNAIISKLWALSNSAKLNYIHKLSCRNFAKIEFGEWGVPLTIVRVKTIERHSATKSVATKFLDLDHAVVKKCNTQNWHYM
jgi:hypothetical protein